MKKRTPRPFKHWTAEEHNTWSRLATRQLKNAEGRVSRRFFDGVKQLGITFDKIPDFTEVSNKLEPLTDWHLVSSALDFADGQSWFESLKKNEFFLTEYIRPSNSLDFTPMPDIFHDAFGHLPYLANSQLSCVIRLFTDLILKADSDNRKKLGHLWWYTIEFGLVKEDGKIKAFGAGLTSSFGELNHAFSEKAKITPFDPKLIGARKESPSGFHDEYFLLDSIDKLEEILRNWKS